MDKNVFNLKFTSKQLTKQARKTKKSENEERNKLKKALMQNNIPAARIYAENVIRKNNEWLGLLRLQSRIDALTARAETAASMRQITGTMNGVVANLGKAMETMNLERMTSIMDRFEAQSEDLDLQTGYMESVIGKTTEQKTPQNQVDLLLSQVADEAGLEIKQNLEGADTTSVPDVAPKQTEGEEDELTKRLKALRPAT